MKHYWAAVAFVAAVALGSFVFWMGSSSEPPAPQAVPVTAAHVDRSASAILARVRRPKKQRAAQEPPTHVTQAQTSSPTGTAPAEEVVDPVVERLNSIERAQQCSRMPHTEDEIEQESARRTIIADKIQEHFGGAPNKNPGKAGVAIALQLQKARDDCANIPPSNISHWKSMLEDLAASGNREAQLAYSHAVWADSQSPAQIALDPNGFNRELEIARDYLWDDVTNGNCDNSALNSLWRIPQLGPVTNYIGWSVLGHQGLEALDKRASDPGVDIERKDIAAESDRLRALVPADQLEETEQAAAQLSQFNCAGR